MVLRRRQTEKGLAVVILAAGKGTRMKSNVVKVLHPLAGRPMLLYVLDLVQSFDPQRLAIVIGFQADQVKKAFKEYSSKWTWVYQTEQKGTADALLAARDVLNDFDGTLLILYGDVPLLKRSTVQMLIEAHHSTGAPVTILTATLRDPTGYGRIVRAQNGTITRIVEELDASEADRAICEINTGIYCMLVPFLFEALATVDANNAKREYYLTDVVAYCVEKGYRVGWYETPEPELTLGINTRKDLAIAEGTLRSEICNRWMLSGITIVDPSHTYIDHEVSIGMDTRIEPNCYVRGKTSVGKDCTLEPGCIITDSYVGDRVRVRALSVIEGSRIEPGSVVGPIAHIGPGTIGASRGGQKGIRRLRINKKRKKS